MMMMLLCVCVHRVRFCTPQSCVGDCVWFSRETQPRGGTIPVISSFILFILILLCWVFPLADIPRRPVICSLNKHHSTSKDHGIVVCTILAVQKSNPKEKRASHSDGYERACQSRPISCKRFGVTRTKQVGSDWKIRERRTFEAIPKCHWCEFSVGVYNKNVDYFTAWNQIDSNLTFIRSDVHRILVTLQSLKYPL